MSANNYIKIKEYIEVPKFRVTMCEAEGGEEMWNIGSCDTLHEACDIASDTQREEEVEYGVQLDLLKHKNIE